MVPRMNTTGKEETMHSVGFEPTHTNILELESSPLDRSGMNARMCVSAKYSICTLKLKDENLLNREVCNPIRHL